MNEVQSKLGEGLTKIQGSLNQGKQKLQLVQEVSQIKSSQNTLRLKRQEYILKIGEVYLQKIHTGVENIELLQELATEIQALDKEIYAYGVRLDQLQSESGEGVECSKCQSPVSDSDKFCGKCGQPVAASVKVETTEICNVCETSIPAKTNYCPCCGTDRRINNMPITTNKV